MTPPLTLNAGPGRIPSSHKHLLGYLNQFGVPVEVYVMNSQSNLVQMDGGPAGDAPSVYRRLEHNTRGWLAEMVYQNAGLFIDEQKCFTTPEEREEQIRWLQSLMVDFGQLNAEGKYVVEAAEDGQDDAADRAGYSSLPGVDAGEIASAFSFETLLQSEFWSKTSFYQPQDFLWQETLFQPVGGMDQVQHAFARQVAAKGGTIRLNSRVDHVDWNGEQYEIQVAKLGTEEKETIAADYVFSNAAMPFLSDILSECLQSPESGLFEPGFKAALQAVYTTQFDKPADEYANRFLSYTTKVGWQADRALWQGGRITARYDESVGQDVLYVPDSEVGVVPIFGGISWTDDAITQIWYPSNDYHDEKGVLTGCYNFSQNAYDMGKLPVPERLELARQGAARFNTSFAEGLEHGVAIAWQNMPHIKGGWPQWHNVEESVTHFNHIAQGTGVDSGLPNFFIVGDQVSSLPGWQEGAIVSALTAVSRLARPDLAIPALSCLPDTRLMVEGA